MSVAPDVTDSRDLQSASIVEAMHSDKGYRGVSLVPCYGFLLIARVLDPHRATPFSSTVS